MRHNTKYPPNLEKCKLLQVSNTSFVLLTLQQVVNVIVKEHYIKPHRYAHYKKSNYQYEQIHPLIIFYQNTGRQLRQMENKQLAEYNKTPCKDNKLE